MGSGLSPGEPDGGPGVPATPDANPTAAEQADTGEPSPRAPAAGPAQWRRRRRKILAWGSGSLAALLVAVLVAGLALLHHFNANIQQDDIRACWARSRSSCIRRRRTSSSSGRTPGSARA